MQDTLYRYTIDTASPVRRSGMRNCVNGAVAGFIAGPVGGILLALQLAVGQNRVIRIDWNLSPETLAGVGILSFYAGLVGVVVGGVPGAIVGAISGLVIGNDPVTPIVRAVIVVVGASVGLAIGTSVVGPVEIGRLALTSPAIAGAAAALVSLRLFVRLRGDRRVATNPPR